MTPQHVTSHAWHPMRTPVRYSYSFGTALCAAVGFGFATRSNGGWLAFLIGGLFAFATIGLATDQQTHIDTAAGMVTREGRLFDRILVWRTRRSLADFSAVTFQRIHDPQGGDSVFVGLLPSRGRFVAVRYFNTTSNGRCDSAVDLCVPPRPRNEPTSSS